MQDFKVLKKASRTAVAFTRKFGPWAATAVIIVLLVLENFKIENVPLEFTLLSMSVVLIFAQLEQSNDELCKAIYKNLRASETITNAVVPKLYSLEECLNDLVGRLAHLTRREEITVRHIGLDLHDAWSEVKRVLTNPILQTNVKYELLVITSEHAKPVR